MSDIVTKSSESVFDRVVRRIAPVWPLDGFVAVNPYWGFVDQAFPEAAAQLQSSVGERMIMDRRWYADQIRNGRPVMPDILKAAESLGLGADEEEWRDYLREIPEPAMRLPTLSELMDRRGHASISQYVLEQISRFLAAYYDRGQSLWQLPRNEGEGLFATWRHYTLSDRSLSPMGLKAIRPILLELPVDATAARLWAQQHLRLPKAAEEDYFLVLLKSIGGWASWCRYLLWQAELQGKGNEDLADLLAIRLVWEALLRQTARRRTLERWQLQLQDWTLTDKSASLEDARRGEVLLRASEIAFRRQVVANIRQRRLSGRKSAACSPRVQAIFCIDVRSEIYRRHLESAMPSLETIGFGGFFGLMMDYRRQGDRAYRPQLPVFLGPKVHVEEHGPETVIQRRVRRLRRSTEWKQFKLSAASCFSFVEAAGLSYVGRLLADTLGWHRPSVPPDEAGFTAADRLKLSYALPDSLSIDDRLDIAEFSLKGFGLNQGGVAPIVLLVGHGSSTTNNPHRTGLDCGACAGQTGEVNARVAANLLNDTRVREGLIDRGWDLDDRTCFLPALHDTTTDRVEILAGLDDPRLDARSLAELNQALEQATNLTRLERIARLKPDLTDPDAIARDMIFRGRDWSQLRPEWALAGNAAFIAAPRWRTREMNLAGRAFLHDYDAAKDPGFGLLTVIMTAPLMVANWIALQYYGSTVDNQRQGCGNKVLHNVVGGTIGVLEGNGGDLRIGLSEQSLRDSNGGLQHEPLRLSAFIEAPAQAIDRIIADHEILRRLVDNRWLNILRISEDGAVQERQAADRWVWI
ncbi:YbcC family protein [Acidiphilium acidophilum]|uniref:Probable inorganic carbon transporter subunit DabA n=1 Tax=Acidiphilium acidophilum TaxID=76588 RepID=A0AAW9DWF1_ACIAO|nr:DUF2309 domain-containing protein [Acidiphilium acidophilum]MDX5933023.1 DUF2309 domain-containing protein [Acidiphilium acidophilum]